jgi:hypothetical protein
VEKPLLTSGDDLIFIREFLGARTRYAAADVVEYLLSGASARAGNPAAAKAPT